MKRVHLVVLFLCAAWLLSGAVFGPGGTASALASPAPGDEAIAITGRVTDALTGAPLPGIEVHAGYWYDEWRGRIWEWINTTTDEQGQYLITVLWAGTWPVYFSDPQARYLTTLHVQVPVGAGQTVTNIDARLELSGHLAGRVTDMVDREPVNGVCVDLYGAGDFAHLKRVYTDAAGHYEVSDLSTGRYLLSFWHPLNYYLPEYYADVQQIDEATPVTVTQGLTTTVNVELLPQGGVSGQVTDAAGDPLGGIDVWATCPVRDAPACSGEAVTDAAGRYAIRILHKDRRFHVVFSDPTGRFASVRYPGTPFWGQAALVPVGPGLLTRGIDAVLPVGGEIRGRLTDAATGAPLAGSVELSAWDGSQWQFWTSAYAKSDGSYQFKTLHPGRYRVRFSGGDMSYAGEYYPGVPDAVDAAAIEIAPGQIVTGIDGSLDAARISGRVTAEATGEPLGNIEVYLSGYLCGYMEWADRVIRTAADGTYGFTHVWPGDCMVYFRDPESDYEEEYYDDTFDKDQATALAVTPGAQFTGIDAALTLRGRITGLVTATTGEPLAGIRVRPYHKNYAGPARGTFTDADGRYMVRGLGAGAYRLLFTDPAQQVAPRYYGPATRQSEATWVTVTLASVVPGIDVQLPPGGRVVGRVTERWGGAPIENAWLRLYRQPFENSAVDYFTTRSDAQGRYELGGLWGGAYQFCVYTYKYEDVCLSLTVVEGELWGQDFALLPSGTAPGLQLWLPFVAGSGASAPRAPGDD